MSITEIDHINGLDGRDIGFRRLSQRLRSVRILSENRLRPEYVDMCSEDVSYMPPVPFRYYMLVFNAYVLELGKREIEERDLLDAPWSAASSFLILVATKLRSEINFIAPIMDDLLPAVEFIAMNQDTYFASQDIYGDFRDQLTRIKKLWGV